MRRRVASLAAAVALLAGVAPGHYHFVHFQSRSAPFEPLYEKFDLSALPDKTLPFFVSSVAGVEFADGDTFPALLSQIRAAAKAWNDVESSELRLAFGGLVDAGAEASGPSLQVVFEEMPPGYVAMGGPIVKAESNGKFVPIVRSVLKLHSDLRKRPSYSEELFGTLVHEMGHALGLQHTFTSGAMSIAQTRATTKAKPLSADDVAGISVLYPASNFAETTGTIAGRVTLSGSGTGVNLASVVAVTATGDAVSTLTNPDGRYQIPGLPAGEYHVYVHPAPPQQNRETLGDLVYPKDAEGREFAPSGPFKTAFYRGDEVVEVKADEATTGINFAVEAASSYGIHSVDTRAFPGKFWVKPPFMTPDMTYSFLIASGENLVSNNAPAAGLKAAVLGTGAEMPVSPYVSGRSTHVQLDPPSLEPSEGPRHLVFTAAGDTYVLPSAFYHVSRPAPRIDTLEAEGSEQTVVVSGQNLDEHTRILFDGIEARVEKIDEQNRLTVVAPPAAPGHQAVVTALNPDGQSSLYLQGDAPPRFAYPAGGGEGHLASIRPAVLPAGTEAMVEVEGLNTEFTAGMIAAAFGSADIAVRDIHVVSATEARFNVAVAANAQPGSREVTVVSGLEVLRDPSAFQIRAAQDDDFWLRSAVLNPGNPEETARAVPGQTAALRIGASPAALTAGDVRVVLNETRVPVVSVNEGVVSFRVPADTPTGPAVVRLEANGEQSLPVLIPIDPAPPPSSRPPRIADIVTTTNSQARLIRLGELVRLTLTDVPKGSVSTVTVSLGGASLRVLHAFESQNRYTVFIQASKGISAGENVPLTVSVDGRASEPVNVTVSE